MKKLFRTVISAFMAGCCALAPSAPLIGNIRQAYAADSDYEETYSYSSGMKTIKGSFEGYDYYVSASGDDVELTLKNTDNNGLDISGSFERALYVQKGIALSPAVSADDHGLELKYDIDAEAYDISGASLGALCKVNGGNNSVYIFNSWKTKNVGDTVVPEREPIASYEIDGTVYDLYELKAIDKVKNTGIDFTYKPEYRSYARTSSDSSCIDISRHISEIKKAGAEISDITECDFYADCYDHAKGIRLNSISVEKNVSAENPFIKGDVNKDGSVDSFDIIELRRAILAEEEGLPEEADMNSDGGINVGDLVCMTRFILGYDDAE